MAHSLFTHPLLTHIQDSQPDPNPAPMDSPPPLPIPLPYLPLCFLSPLHCGHSLHCSISLHLKAGLFLLHNLGHSQHFQALIRYLLMGFSSILFLFVHVYITALWHLASVVSVLELVYGFSATKKSYKLLKGKILYTFVLVFVYLAICGVIGWVFGSVVVHGGENFGVFVRIVVGGFLVGVLVIVNLVGLLVQSVFYYVCKSYHHQGIDKLALHDHLGGYLEEYVPLKSSIQMENLEM